jgi:hypothetical protein
MERKINWKLIIAAAIIDYLGTTIVQYILGNFTANMYVLIFWGGLVSIFAGYFLVSGVGKKIDMHIYLLCLITFLTGIAILFYNNAINFDNLKFLILTPMLNFLGGFLASKKIILT